MAEDSKLSWKIKWQITRFANRLTGGLDKAKRRFVRQMLYGIQASKDVKLSSISRTLNESIALIKTENRLSRNLSDRDLSGKLNDFVCWEGAGKVGCETVLAVDLGDVRKNYAEKMECLARVRDGSTGEIVDGYWLCEVLGAEVHGEMVVPLYGELYSQEAADFVSENEQILKAIRKVSAVTARRGIYTIDRGGDRRKLLIPLLDMGLRFVVRQDGDRHIVMPGGVKCAARQAARWCKTSERRRVELERDGKRKKHRLGMGSMPVTLPERPERQLWLVVIRGFAQEPIVLLTNVAPRCAREHAGRILDVYLTRWKCEEAYRFLKQAYSLEDVRVRSYVGLRNIYALVHVTFYFVSAVIGMKAKLNLLFKKVCEKSKRFYEVADFFHYAVADGIHRLLFGSRSGPHVPPDPPGGKQLLFSFASPPT